MMRSRYGDHWLGFSTEQVESWLEDAGFSIDDRQHYPVLKDLQVFLYRGSKKARSSPRFEEAYEKRKTRHS
jgi:hypothetical protein